MLGAGYSGKVMKGYVSWGGYNLFLTPAHDWMHDCILEWTRMWDSALMTSTVWPNHYQGIIIMLSGGKWFHTQMRKIT